MRSGKAPYHANKRSEPGEGKCSGRPAGVRRLHRLWQSTEDDRRARMDQIVELTRLLKKAEADIAETNTTWKIMIQRKISGLLNKRG